VSGHGVAAHNLSFTKQEASYLDILEATVLHFG